jgi:alkyl sulfatase BDS1-like metallo-beta-lactamase superfamily hydrolase
MYGALLPKGDKGQVDGGLGKTTSLGSVTLIAPTDVITKTGETRNIDGVEMIFQMAPETEAPTEMLIYFPKFRVLDAAEDCTHTLHNLYTLRGAEVRNSKAWWKALNEAIGLFGDKSDIMIAQHHWPKWGQEKIVDMMKKQRDMYKFIHDQTLRYMNKGYTSTEIAEKLTLPPSLSNEWYNRGYYGSVSHDIKAVYQKYLGWYDGNPANLHILPPEDASKKYVEFMGGPNEVIKKARESFKNGEYRWVAMVMNNVVFAYPDNEEARFLEADALEQLGYQAESGPWRNEYLMGAFELRNGVPKLPPLSTASPDVITSMSLDMFFDYMGIRLNGEKAEGKKIILNWNFTDTKEQYTLNLENSALTYTPGKMSAKSDATINLDRTTLNKIIMKETTFEDEIKSGNIKVDGDSRKISELMELQDDFEVMFNIVTP